MRNSLLSSDSQSQQGWTCVYVVTEQNELGRGRWVSQEALPEEVAVEWGLEE